MVELVLTLTKQRERARRLEPREATYDWLFFLLALSLLTPTPTYANGDGDYHDEEDEECEELPDGRLILPNGEIIEEVDEELCVSGSGSGRVEEDLTYANSFRDRTFQEFSDLINAPFFSQAQTQALQGILSSLIENALANQQAVTLQDILLRLGSSPLFTPDDIFEITQTFPLTSPGGRAPATSTISLTFNQNDGEVRLDLLSLLSPDLRDSLTLTSFSLTSNNTARPIEFTIDEDTGIIALDTTQFEDLGEGDAEIITFTIVTTSSTGPPTTTTGTFTIIGENDPPRERGPITADDLETPVEIEVLIGAVNPTAPNIFEIGAITSDFPTPIVTIDPTTGTLFITPPPPEDIPPGGGTLSIIISINATTFINQTITITNTGGVLIFNPQTPVLTTQNGGPLAINLTTGIEDPDTGDSFVITNVTITSDNTGRTVTPLNPVGPDGVLTLDPDQFEDLGPGETEVITITFTATDTNGGTTTFTQNITITGVNDPPREVPPTVITDPTTQDVVLKASIGALDPNTTQAFEITGITSTTLTPTNITIDPLTGLITLDPQEFTGLPDNTPETTTITVTITSDTGETTTIEQTFTVINTGGILTFTPEAPIITTQDGGPLVVNLDTFVEDPDTGDSFVITSITVTSDNTARTVNFTTNNGNITIDPAQFIDLGVNETETLTITFTATDTNGASTMFTETLTIVGENNPPIFTPPPPLITPVTGEPIIVDLADGISPASPSTNLTYTLTSATSDNPLRNLMVDIDPSTGELQLTPGDFSDIPSGTTETLSFVILITDDTGTTTTVTQTVTVTGDNGNIIVQLQPPIFISELADPVEINILTGVSDVDTNDTLRVESILVTAAQPVNTDIDLINGILTLDPEQFASLAAGEILTIIYTVTVTDDNGGQTTFDRTINVIGSNSNATISGTTTGEVQEDTNTVIIGTDTFITTSGQLSITDPDTGEAEFQPGPYTAGLGTLTLETDGTWTYSVDNTLSQIQTLGNGDTLLDTIQVLSADGTPQIITITIQGTNDAAIIGGITTGTVTEDDAPLLITSGQLTITDVDAGEDTFQAGPYTGLFGTLTLDPGGSWTYTAANNQPTIQNLGPGDTLLDPITVLSTDGTEQTILITINGINDPASIGGTVIGTVVEDSLLTTTGQLTINDPDPNQDTFQAGNYSGSFGSINLQTNGTWIYTLNNSLPAVQALDPGETLQDTITVLSADGTEQIITITINGTADGGIIGGTLTGQVTEDDDPTNLTTSGTLTAPDPFIAGDSVGLGTLTLNDDGTWTYTVNNTLNAIQSLGEGDTLIDSFPVSTTNGDTETLQIIIQGTNDAAIIGGITTGTVTEDDAPLLTTSGQLTITDVDTGEDSFQVGSYTGLFGTLTLDPGGSWTYTAANNQPTIQNLGPGDTLLDPITVLSTDGTEQTILITINGVNDPANIGGTVTGTVVEDTILTTDGQLTISDADGEDTFQAGNYGGTFGSINLQPNGSWIYTLNNSLPAVQDLDPGETLQDTITVLSADGTEQIITITINGTADGGVIGGTLTGQVTEDDDPTSLTTAGTLTAPDPFIAGDSVGLGTLTLNPDGTWTYTVDNTLNAIQSLGNGDSFIDSFLVSTTTGNTETLQIIIQGTNDAAIIGGVTTGTVTEDDAPLLITSGQLTITDVDTGEDTFQAGSYTGLFGNLNLLASGAWTYVAANNQAAIQNLSIGDTLLDSITVFSADGTAQTIEITFTGTDDLTIINGDLTGTVLEDAADTLTTFGSLTISASETFVAGDYTSPLNLGILTLNENGDWTYSVDNNLDEIQSLGDNDTLTEIIPIITAGGLTQNIEIIIRGINDPPFISGTTMGIATEDDAAILEIMGKLNITDIDQDEAGFIAQTYPGTVGSLEIDEMGNWTYSADNTQPAIQSLGEGGFLEETITVFSIDGTAQDIKVRINGINDAAVISGDTMGVVTEDDAAILEIMGKLNITDVDQDEAGFIAQTYPGNVGSLEIDEMGNWTYSADNTQTAIQSLGEGGFLEETITVFSIDGTTQDIKVRINGINDAAVISGDTMGVATEDDATILEIMGKLNITDVDQDEAGFIAQTYPGTVGSLEIDEMGNWTYSADNTQTAIQSLGEGGFLEETITVFSIDGTAQDIKVRINGINDPAVISGDTMGVVTEDDAAILEIMGKLNITDVDQDEAGFIAQTYPGTVGSLEIDEMGNWTYSADNTQTAIQSLGSTDFIEETITVFSIDGTAQDIKVRINGINDAAVISGDTMGVVTEDDAAILEIMGKLNITDVDQDEAGFIAQTYPGTVGSLEIDEMGNWTYSADNTQSAIQSLGSTDFIEETITVFSIDGTAQDIVIRIHGINDAPVGNSDFAKTTENVPVTLNLLANDTDAEDGIPSGNIEILSPLSKGTLTVNGGEITFDPGDDFKGLQAGESVDVIIKYRVTDSEGTPSNPTLATITVFGVDAPIPTLNELNGNNGFVINGEAARNQSSWVVSEAGDVNGDGIDDIIIGAPHLRTKDNEPGKAYVVFGSTSGFNPSLDVADLDGTNGFEINGEFAQDRAGFSVSAAGDINGDGIEDFVIGAYLFDTRVHSDTINNVGRSYVIFGQDQYNGSYELSLLNTTQQLQGFTIDGLTANDQLGLSVSNAGDINGDGFDDVIVGARNGDPLNLTTPNKPNDVLSNAGESYVILGKGSIFEESIDLNNLGEDGFVINGASKNDRSGESVSTAGDINGDGIDDLIIGAPRGDGGGNDSGEVYVVYGKKDGFGDSFELGNINGTNGFVINGINQKDQAGVFVKQAGDINGDGLDDIAIGAWRADPNGTESGQAYVVFGGITGSTLDLNDLDGSNGFILNGIDAKDRAGISVSTAGDINGDGIEDLIVGAQLADPVNPNNTSRVLGSAGEVYVIFGQNDYGKREFELADLNMDGELRGFKVDGLSGGDQLGRSVSSAGDVNGDGYDDLLLGAPNGDPLDDTSSKISNAGETYVIFGGDFDGLQTQLGTAEDDILQGSPGADVMVGRIGADTLLTAGGEDVAYGGAGNDIINIIDTSFIRLEGGPGRDTLQWNSDQTLDFTMVADNRLDSIEVIEFLKPGGSLILGVDDVLDLTRAPNEFIDGAHHLDIQGGEMNQVTLVGNWTLESTNTSQVYTSQSTEIVIDADIQVFTS